MHNYSINLCRQKCFIHHTRCFLKWKIVISVILIDEVDDDFDHCVFFFGATFGDHQGEGDKGVVGDALGTVLIIKDAVAIEEP